MLGIKLFVQFMAKGWVSRIRMKKKRVLKQFRKYGTVPSSWNLFDS